MLLLIFILFSLIYTSARRQCTALGSVRSGQGSNISSNMTHHKAWLGGQSMHPAAAPDAAAALGVVEPFRRLLALLLLLLLALPPPSCPLSNTSEYMEEQQSSSGCCWATCKQKPKAAD